MTYTAASQSRGRGPLRRLRARLHKRLDAKSERGDLLIEVVIAMAVIGTTLASYTSSNMTMEHVSRSRTAVDIVAQQAQAVLQEAKSSPWDRLGFNPAVQSNVPDTDAEGQFTVTHDLPSVPGSLTPFKEVERGNITMTQRVDIVWEGCTDAAACATRSSAAFDTKKVTVTINFRVPGSTEEKKKVYTMSRSATASEAVPRDTIPTAEGPGGSVGGLFCPVPRSEDATLVWDPVPTAVKYFVSAKWAGMEFPPGEFTDTSAYPGAAGMGQGLSFKVDPVDAAGNQLSCPWTEF